MRQPQAPNEPHRVCAKHGLSCASLDREQLVLNVAHELKSPLTGLRLHVERAQRTLARDESTAQTEPFKRFVTQIDHGLARMQRLIEDLLDATRFDAGNMPLKLDKTSIAAVVKAVEQELEPQATRHGFELKSDLRDEACGVWDASRLQQVLSNLINNAMRYGASPVEITVQTRSSLVEVSVRDHGEGILDAERECIFQRFERGHSAEGTGGLGLGLAICQSIIEAHGGSIRVETPAAGTGCVFAFSLPYAGADGGPDASH